MTASNPIQPGETVIVYLTGFGQAATPGADGTLASGPDAISPACGGPEYMQLGTPLYIGLTPGFVGLYQMNIQVLTTLSPGPLDFYVNWPQCFGPDAPINFAQSNTVTLPIQ